MSERSACAAPMSCTTCPLCGGPNECGPAATGSFSGPACWCVNVRFSKELLDKVPLTLQGKACICRRCAESQGAPQSAQT